MQGPVSDRQWLSSGMIPAEEFEERMKLAMDLISQGKSEEVMPRHTGVISFFPPITAYRWHSLAAVGGDDDYFSTDLSDDRLRETFGRLVKPTLFLHSANDEAVPAEVNKDSLIQKWATFAPEGVVSDLSGVIPNASHQVKEHEARLWVADVVEKFLKSI